RFQGQSMGVTLYNECGHRYAKQGTAVAMKSKHKLTDEPQSRFNAMTAEITQRSNSDMSNFMLATAPTMSSARVIQRACRGRSGGSAREPWQRKSRPSRQTSL